MTTKTTTLPDTLEQAVTRFFHMLNSHCPGNVVALLTQDVELIADETATGSDAVNAFFIRLWEAYPCINFTVENLIINESAVAAEVTFDGGPGGKGDRCMVFQFRGDKIRRVRCY